MQDQAQKVRLGIINKIIRAYLISSFIANPTSLNLPGLALWDLLAGPRPRPQNLGRTELIFSGINQVHEEQV